MSELNLNLPGTSKHALVGLMMDDSTMYGVGTGIEGTEGTALDICLSAQMYTVSREQRAGFNGGRQRLCHAVLCIKHILAYCRYRAQPCLADTWISR